MENLVREKSAKTPYVEFNADSGELTIEGISIPEDTVNFYHSLLYWINEYSITPQPKTILNLKLEYFNTSTSVVLLNIFKLFSEMQNTEVIINWYYEEEDIEMEEVGNDYREMVGVEFNIHAVESF